MISSVTNKGYALDTASDILSVSAIEEALSRIFPKQSADKIRRITDRIVIYDCLESTNKTAKLSLITGETEKKFNRISINGTVVCGILSEYFADMETGTVSGYVIGIGIKNIPVSKNEAVAKILSAF